jgi:hypothetical protein
MTTGKPLPKDVIQKMREEVLKGKTKYRVSKEMGLNECIVYSHTSDLPSVKLGEPCIRGRALDLLKQLLDVGYVPSSIENYQALQKLRRFLPMIQHTRIDYKWIFYLSDKNKAALKAMITLNRSKIISYQELKSITKMFGVELSRLEKHDYVKPARNHTIPVIRKEKGGFLSSMKKNQARLDDFTVEDGSLGRNQLKRSRKFRVEKSDALRENEDSLAFFYIRKYWTECPREFNEGIKKWKNEMSLRYFDFHNP